MTPTPRVPGHAVMTGLAALMALAGAACGAPTAAVQVPPPGPTAERAWVELTAAGAEARLVTASADCPAAIVDGKPTPMQRRATLTADFADSVCELPLPQGVAHASVGGHALPLPVAKPQRILIFGDTGCRLKGSDIQNCNQSREWPFAVVARLAAAHKPDLVIHVGDYYYRESPCPAGRAGCAGSPWGDNGVTWDADFFAPAAPLLAAAPWVMVRGNHESCLRGGAGWFRLLDAARAPLACPANSAAFAVPIGGLNLYVLDSADADDSLAPPDAVARIATQLDALKGPLKSEPGWILTHRPVWGLAPVLRMLPFGPVEVPLDVTEQEALRGRDLSAVTMVVSGHIHHFASFSFGPARPAQLIVGTGGDVGDPGDTPKFRTETPSLEGMPAKSFGFERYGFLILERAGDDWTGAFYDVDDRVIARCRLVGRALTCGPA